MLARVLKGMMGARVYPQLGCAPGPLGCRLSFGRIGKTPVTRGVEERKGG